MKVLFAVFGDETRGSTRYRVLNMLPYLRDAGHECNVISLVEPDDVPGPRQVKKLVFGLKLVKFALSLLVLAPRYDVVYLQKIPPTPTYIKILTIVANDVIYDFDDALHTTKPWEDDATPKWKSNLNATLGAVSLVATGSPTLSEYATQFNDRTRSLPTPMPREPYEEKLRELEKQDGNPGNDDEQVILGWIGYPENLWYLTTVEDALQTVLDKYEHVQLHIITAGEMPVKPFADRDDVIYREWSLEKQIDYPAEADIGIRPLTDDEWTRSKNFASVNQFMALGKPVVVTPVGMLNENVVHGDSGFHATTEEEWIEYLSILIEDPELRDEMGAHALQAVEDNRFWLDQRAEELIETIESLG